MITILSLLEGRNDNYVISRLIRAFNLEIFKENLMSIYDGYIKFYKNVVYDHHIFCHHSSNEDYEFGNPRNPQDLKPEYYTVIIEVGFMIFHLMKTFQDNDDPENREMLEDELPELELEDDTEAFFGAKLLGGLGKFGVAFIKDTMKSVVQATEMLQLTGNKGPSVENSMILDAAYDFFGKYTGNVEVVFNNSITKVYFWLPPEYDGLNDEIKESFHTNADRTSDQTKLRYLMIKADDIIEQIRHNHRLQKIYEKYPFVSLIASNVSLWGDVAFMCTLILNFFIISSFSYYGEHSLNDPSLFFFDHFKYVGGLTSKDTENAFTTLGTILMACCVIIVSFFLLKTGPVLAKRGWNKNGPTLEFWKSNPSYFKMIRKRIKQCLWTALYIFSNMNVLYYMTYLIVATLGVAIHPFYFSLLLLDILYRYPSLQNVIRSITMPRKALILTFILMLVIVYIYGLVGY